MNAQLQPSTITPTQAVFLDMGSRVLGSAIIGAARGGPVRPARPRRRWLDVDRHAEITILEASTRSHRSADEKAASRYDRRTALRCSASAARCWPRACCMTDREKPADEQHVFINAISSARVSHSAPASGGGV